jgi:serine/threonine-protein kinase
LIAIGAVAAYVLFRSSGGSPSGGGGGSATVSAVTAYDPFGTGAPGENNADAKLASDGNEATYWPTERYYDETLGKPGVGLVLRAAGSGKVTRLVVTTDTPGFTAEIKAGSAENTFPDVVSGPQVVSAQTTFTIGGSEHPYYLLWITDLGSHQVVHVNEVRTG